MGWDRKLQAFNQGSNQGGLSGNHPSSWSYKGPPKNYLFGTKDAPITLACMYAQSCPTFCDPKDHSPPGSSVHGILQVRVLEWVAMPSRGSSWHRDRTPVSCITGRFFITEPPRKPLNTLTTLEIPRFFVALCQELGTKTTYIFVIIPQEHSNWYIGTHPDLDMQGFSTFKLRSVWVSLQKYDIHSSWQYLSTPVLCARQHVRPGYTVVMRCPWRHESVMKLSCNTVVGCHQTNTPSCMYSTQMHLLDTLLLLLHCLFGWWGGGRDLWTKRQNYSKYSRKSRPNKEKKRRHRHQERETRVGLTGEAESPGEIWGDLLLLQHSRIISIC